MEIQVVKSLIQGLKVGAGGHVLILRNEDNTKYVGTSLGQIDIVSFAPFSSFSTFEHFSGQEMYYLLSYVTLTSDPVAKNFRKHHSQSMKPFKRMDYPFHLSLLAPKME